MAREKVEEASSGCILVTCGTFSFICGIIGLFRIWIFTLFVSNHFVLKHTFPFEAVLAVGGFKIPCTRPETHGTNPIFTDIT